MTSASNLSVAPTGAWLAQAAEQVRQRGLTKLATELLTFAARHGLRVEWAEEGRRYATVHRTDDSYESHYLQVIWGDRYTVVTVNKTGGRTWRGGSFAKRISGRQAYSWMMVLEGK